MTRRQNFYADYYAATAGRCGHIWIKPGRTKKKLHAMARAAELDRRRWKRDYSRRMKQVLEIFKQGLKMKGKP